MSSPDKKIFIVEVGPRDGLQNVKEILSIDQKRSLIQTLIDKGFTDIEAGSFVRPDKVPSMADTPQIADYFASSRNQLWYLVPNLKGLEAALTHPVSQFAFFTAASESFNRKNIGMGVEKSATVIEECVRHLRENGYTFVNRWDRKPSKPKELKLRLYISTVIGCPYEGKMRPSSTLKILDRLFPLGFSQASLGDTIGVGKPPDWEKLLGAMDPALIRNNQLAMHCHDTYATALNCIGKGLELGIRTFDASIGGLGGCPFAPGATGNVATEEVLYFLRREGFPIPVRPENLLDVFSPSRTGSLSNRSRVLNGSKNKKNAPS